MKNETNKGYIINDHSQSDNIKPIKVLLRIIHDSLKRSKYHAPPMRMSELDDRHQCSTPVESPESSPKSKRTNSETSSKCASTEKIKINIKLDLSKREPDVTEKDGNTSNSENSRTAPETKDLSILIDLHICNSTPDESPNSQAESVANSLESQLREDESDIHHTESEQSISDRQLDVSSNTESKSEPSDKRQSVNGEDEISFQFDSSENFSSDLLNYMSFSSSIGKLDSVKEAMSSPKKTQNKETDANDCAEINRTYSVYTDTERDRISALIHQLIMEKYGDVLRKIQQRSSRRHLQLRQIIFFDESLTPEAAIDQLIEKCLDDISQTVSTDSESVDSGLTHSTGNLMEKDAEEYDLEEPEYAEVEYDAGTFLREALGNDLSGEDQSHYYSNGTSDRQTYSTDHSIGSSNISTLLSSTGHKSQDVYSLYSTINKKVPKNRNKSNTFNSLSSNECHYESVEECKMALRENRIINDIAQQWGVINQVSKALDICRNKRRCFEGGVLIEAEKILLVACIKRDLLKNQLKQIPSENSSSITTLSLVIRNVKFYLKPNVERKKNYSWHFLYVAQYGSCVKASKVVKDEKEEIRFQDIITFDGSASDKEIHLAVYGLVLKDIGDKSSSNKKILSWRTRPKHYNTQTHPSFKQLGQTTIQNLRTNKKVFPLTNTEPCSLLGHFVADIESNLVLNVKEEGFLTIGTNYKECPVWNRRWCTLDGCHFKYWNYPHEDEVCPPLGQLNLTNCAMGQVMTAGKDVCSRPKTLLLVMREDTRTKKYFLCADSLSDFEVWQRQLNLVLSLLRKWNDN